MLIPRVIHPRLLLLPIPLPPHQRALNPLILMRRVLEFLPPVSAFVVVVPLDLVAAARAAARGDEPEEAATEGEGDGKPDGDVDGVPEGALDVVFLEGGVEGAREGGVEDRGCEGEGDGEER